MRSKKKAVPWFSQVNSLERGDFWIKGFTLSIRCRCNLPASSRHGDCAADVAIRGSAQEEDVKYVYG